MKKPAAPAQGTQFTEKDADRLIASYGQVPVPEKKAALLARLGAERPAFEKARAQPARQPEKGRDR